MLQSWQTGVPTHTFKQALCEIGPLALPQIRIDRIGGKAASQNARNDRRGVRRKTADAVRLYGGNAVWKDVAQRLLDNTCQHRTGRHDEDGCWPAFETP